MKANRIEKVMLTDWDRRCMAYHEAGHAVCSYFLSERERLLSITIDPSDETFGMIRTEIRPHHNETEISFISTIATFLAGRLAEEIFLGIKSSSCVYDLASARELAKTMVCRLGMGSRIGLMSIEDVSDNSFQMRGEYIKNEIDADIRDIINRGKLIAEKELVKNKEIVEKLATILLDKKSMSQKEIESFFESNKKGHA